MRKLVILALLLLSFAPAYPSVSADGWSLRIVEQPRGCYGCVTVQPGEATFFAAPWRQSGTFGLLAHNYLSGAWFFDLRIGDRVTVNLQTESKTFIVTEILSYYAVKPGNPATNVTDWSGRKLSQAEVYERVYNRPGGLTLQTSLGCNYCGWYFVLAEPD